MSNLQIKAMNKLEEDRSKFNINDVFIIAKFINDYEKIIPEGIVYQIIKDLGVYKKYDAIAMWVGDGGLIYYEPEFIKELVKIFEIEE